MSRSPVLALAFAALALSCPPAWAQAGSEDPAALTILTSFPIMDLNPSGGSAHYMSKFGTGEMLMQFREDGLQHPWLLQALDQQSENVWVLTLRPGITFQNGKPVDAAAVLAAIEWQLEHSAAARGSIPLDARFAVTGDLEITVTTETPFAGLPGALAHEQVFPIFDAETVAAADGDWQALVGAGIYTGPFIVTGLDAEGATLERYDGYWQGRPVLPGVTIGFVTDANARILAVQNGEADIAFYPPIASRPVIEATPGLHFNFSTPNPNAFTMILNVAEAPFDDPAVRLAVIDAVDYGEIAEDVFGGVFEPATGFYRPMFPWALENQHTDLGTAEALLDEAGWAAGSDGVRTKDGERLRLTLMLNPGLPDLVALGNALQAQLVETGIEVELVGVTDIFAAMGGDAQSWDGGILNDATAPFGVPETFLTRYLGADGDRNFGGYDNAELEALTQELGMTLDEARRNEILARLQKILIEEDPGAFILTFNRDVVITNDAYAHYQPGFNFYHLSWETGPATP